CPSGPALLLESARWLLATQQLERARETLQALAKGNGSGSDNSSCHQESHLGACWKPCLRGSPQPWYHALCKIFSTRVIWENSVILGFVMFISFGICHCFTCNLSPCLPHFSCYFVLVGTKATACLFFLTAEHFGHHTILLLCTILTGISSLLVLALTQYLLDLIILTSSVVGITASHAITMLSIFFASKVLPTVVRGTRLGLVLGASFMCKALAPITAIPNSHSFLHHVVFTFFGILAILSIMLLPETQHACSNPYRTAKASAGPPLFHRLFHKDHMPLLIPYGIPHDYTCLTTSTKRMRLPGHPPRDVDMPPTPHQGFSTAGGTEHGAVTPIGGCLQGRWGAPGHMQWRG
ncbi:LOW QUALITY PROTEIN: putative solute carrier family 22 member 31, partial [Amazona ochrocephala]